MLLIYSLTMLLLLPSSLCATGCYPSRDCESSISGDCDQISNDYTDHGVSTFFRPRTITTDLTYRNSMTFYQRFRGDASCAFFTFDSTFLYQKNRKATRIGRGFFGQNPIRVAENCAPLNSLNLSLGNTQPEGPSSCVRFSPKRKVFGWLPQFIFHFDRWLPGLWADMAFAVVRADHRICFYEQLDPAGDIGDIATVQQACNKLDVFPDETHHTGIDDIEVRYGYTVHYCEDDIISLYLLGSIPTGKKFDNSRFFQPLVGSRNGGLGTGLMFDNTLWYAEDTDSECLLMLELKYQHKFSNTECRQYDYCNGPLSRFLLTTPLENPNNPRSGIDLLRAPTKVEPRNTLDFWLSIHYERCGWGFESAYNLFWRDEEIVRPCGFNFEEHGIFDNTRCSGRTSHSTARISDPFGVGTPDPSFVVLTSEVVNECPAAAREALSHTFSGVITYNSIWCDYPFSFALAARYEIAGTNEHTSTLENWGVFGKASVSF